ncbi:MAG: hypothetical protein ACREJN_07810 [Nitrospiraceae bacterium]
MRCYTQDYPQKVGTTQSSDEHDDGLGIKQKGQDQVTLLELVLRVQGDFRSQLATLHVTPLQAGMILYLHRQKEASMTDTAATVGVAGPTLSVAIRTPLRKRWVAEHRTPDNRRVVRLRLTRRCEVQARKITERIRDLGSNLIPMKEA